MRVAAAALLVVLIAGCSHVIAGTPTKERQTLDCNLIFPGPDNRR